MKEPCKLIKKSFFSIYIINLWADFIHTTYYINGNQKFKKSDALYIRVRLFLVGLFHYEYCK